jgi:hypothetical protein
MRTFLRNNAIALVALFVALGGTGYAAAKLTGRDVKPNTLTGKQVKESTLDVARIAARATGDDTVVAPTPSTPSPEDPEDFGALYPVKPATFRLDGPALLKPAGEMKVETVSAPCAFAFFTANVFSNGRLIGFGGSPLPLPEGQDSVPFGILASASRVSRGTQRIQVRVSSSCIFGGTGAVAEVEEVDLSVIAYR